MLVRRTPFFYGWIILASIMLSGTLMTGITTWGLGVFIIPMEEELGWSRAMLFGAIAVGAMVDAAVVMIENAHKHLEHWHADNPGRDLTGHERWSVIGESAAEVGPALFFSLLIITLSFIPVFTLEAQEGRLFGPLAESVVQAVAEQVEQRLWHGRLRL